MSMVTADMKVLVVDDTATNRQILTVFLRKLGFTVITADDGQQAVDKFALESPDIILMDVMMPVMDGYEATRRIKQVSGSRWVPVIFLSALDKEENLVAGLDAGGDDYLHKPVNFVILDAKLRSLVRTLDLQKRLDENAKRLQAYHDVQEAEQALAEDIVKRQMLRKGLSDPSVQHWVSPAENFSGDIVAATRCPAGNLYVLLADATGHGLGAAICTLPVLSVFYSMAENQMPLRQIVDEVNRQLLATMPVGRFVAATLLMINQAEGRADIWMGGMPEMLLIDAAGEPKQTFRAEYLPMGVIELDPAETQPATVTIAKSDQFVMFSDGLVEAENGAKEPFGMERLFAALRSVPGAERMAALQASLEGHVGSGRPHDDVSVLIVNAG